MNYGPLGAAETYQAAIHLLGGARAWAQIPRLTEVTWGRVLDDYSEASCTVAKADMDTNTAALLGNTHGWGHELTIYRDGQYVWQGPITGKSEFGDRFELEARDMLAWLDRRRNPRPWNWTEPTDQNPGAWGAGPVGDILSTVITDAFAEHDPGFMEWVWIAPNSRTATLQAMQTRETVAGDAVRSLIDYGMDLYTVGRHIYCVTEDISRAREPLRLTETDFGDDIELREVGLDAATRGVVIGSQPENAVATDGTQPAANQPPPIGVHPDPPGGVDPFYGLLEYGLSSRSATTQQAVDWLAAVLSVYNAPPVMSIIVPQSAGLSPQAPVSIDELVPAQRVLIRLESYTTPAVEEFLINEVEVTASAAQGQGMTEQVSISVTSKRAAAEAEVTGT